MASAYLPEREVCNAISDCLREPEAVELARKFPDLLKIVSKFPSIMGDDITPKLMEYLIAPPDFVHLTSAKAGIFQGT